MDESVNGSLNDSQMYINSPKAINDCSLNESSVYSQDSSHGLMNINPGTPSFSESSSLNFSDKQEKNLKVEKATDDEEGTPEKSQKPSGKSSHFLHDILDIKLERENSPEVKDYKEAEGMLSVESLSHSFSPQHQQFALNNRSGLGK